MIDPTRIRQAFDRAATGFDENDFLHREIREKGGAYGGMAGYNADGGLFSMLSYRDPHLERTLDVYEDAIKWACKGNFSVRKVPGTLVEMAPQGPRYSLGASGFGS